MRAVVSNEHVKLAIPAAVCQHMPMIRSKIIFVVTAALALASTVPATAAPLNPTGKWVVDYEDQACIATRAYGTATNPVHLTLKPSPRGGTMQLSILQKGSRGTVAVEEFGKMSLDGGRDLPISILSFGSSDVLYATRVNLSAESFAALRTARTLQIRGRSTDETFVLEQLPELMKQIDACVVDLEAAWNMGPDASTKIRSRASGSLVGLFSSEDYPAAATRTLKSGSVTVVLLINERGKVADCSVTVTSGAAGLDAQACAVISQRANFKPAIGFDGKPTRDTFSQRVNWQNQPR